MTIDKALHENKQKLLDYFRLRSEESLEEVRREIGTGEIKKQAAAINKEIIRTRDNLVRTIQQTAGNDSWSNDLLLRTVLMTTYASYVVMLEARNNVWPYEYMAFSRRIGELWEPFCSLCFEYPIQELRLFVPPLFSDVKRQFTEEIEDYIGELALTPEQKHELKNYYSKIWKLVASGEIKLELDLHFIRNDERIVVDFKSGFGSNEKGNTNRLLLVASVYKAIVEPYTCVLLVRAEEDTNNHYFQTLKNSGIWEAYCGRDAYALIEKFTGFDMFEWISDNISWENDFSEATYAHFVENDLEKYLRW